MTAAATPTAFLAWIRQGIGSFVGNAVDPSSPLRPVVSVALQVQQTTEGTPGTVTERSVPVTLPMFGPEDVVSLDVSAITRVWPRPDTDDTESPFFPLIEFSEPDLPWRFSLVGTDVPTGNREETTKRVVPWLALIVLREDEFEFLPSGTDQRLATVTVKSHARLPDLTQAWAWAHVDAQGDGPVTADQLRGGTSSGRRIVSRLIAARRLHPRARYAAFVVPVYLRACEVLLGRAVRSGTDLAWNVQPDGTARATDPAEPLTLPVYHHWRFGTGAEGDFASLGQRLEPGTVDELRGTALVGDAPTPGTRPIAIGPLPTGMRASATQVELGGALRPIDARDAELVSIDASADGPWSLEYLLRQTAQVTGNPLVGPPFYGRWHAATRSFEIPWVREVNLDLRHRIVAGAGAEIVQEQQQALMAGAWAQLEGIRGINELLRFSQLSREGSSRVYCRDFCSLPANAFLALTAPVHAQVRCGAETVAATLAGSRLLPGSLDPQWRRLSRPRGPLARRQARVGQALNPYDRMNEGRFPVAGPPPTPSSLNTSATAFANGAAQTGASPKDEKKAAVVCPELPLFAQAILAIVEALLSDPARASSFDPDGRWRALHEDARAGRCNDVLARLLGLLRGMDLPADYHAGGGASGTAVDPRAILEVFIQRLETSSRVRSRVAVQPPRIDLAALVDSLRSGLDPRRTIALGVTSRLNFAGTGVLQNPADPLEPVMACPIFPQPMFGPLYDRSPAWLLPGLENLPNNRVLPTEANQAFIKAYMVGVNHEMATELLWNEYPTDRRGTAFAQFWPVTGAAAGTPDILPLHQWGASPLERPRSSGGGVRTPLVFVIRGDLLRRYPNVTFFATTQQGASDHSAAIRPATFVGQLPPDTAFVGVDLTLEEAEGSMPDWRLVIQEPAGESRFRLPTNSGYAELPIYRPENAGQSVYLNVEPPPIPGGPVVPSAAGESAPISSAEVAKRLLHPMTWLVFDISTLIQSARGVS